MQIIYNEYPPNYEAIAKTFNIKGRTRVVFTYGDKLYVPSGEPVDKYLLRHEETHAREQTEMGAEAWWERYLVDPGFRFKQELEAYRAQYKLMGDLRLETRLSYLDHIATDLAGEMYGNLVTKDEAKTEITKNIILKYTGTSSLKARKLKKLKRQNRKKGRR